MICEDSPILKVCPFCYADAYVSIQKHYDKPDEVQIICTKCGCRCRPFPVQNNRPGGVAETVAEAAKHWNSSYILGKDPYFFDFDDEVRLLLCPFCHDEGRPSVYVQRGQGVCVRCTTCGTSTAYFSDGYNAFRQAVDAWNMDRIEEIFLGRKNVNYSRFSDGKADVRYE